MYNMYVCTYVPNTEYLVPSTYYLVPGAYYQNLLKMGIEEIRIMMVLARGEALHIYIYIYTYENVYVYIPTKQVYRLVPIAHCPCRM